MQSVALYGAEVWWKGQENRKLKLQKLINRQARAITGALTKLTPEGPLVKEAGLTPTGPLLDKQQRNYALRLLGLSDRHPAKELLPFIIRYRDLATDAADER